MMKGPPCSRRVSTVLSMIRTLTLSALTLSAAALLVAPVLSQINPNLGAPQNLGDDDETGPLSLGFSFTMPGGSVLTTVEATSNGRVFRVNGDGADFTPTIGEFLGGPATIAPFWTDLNPASSGDVFFNALPGVALITWSDIVLFGGSTQFSFQLQLFPDNSFKVIYDSRVPSDNPLVGVTQGGGASNPGASDLSSGPSSNGNATLYEFFGQFDLSPGELTFTPDGSGGYNVSVSAPARAMTEVGAPGCVGPRLRLSPNGQGGYDTSFDGGYDSLFATGTGLGLGDDATADVALGFPFPMPGGTVVTSIRVDSNGRLSDPAANLGSDFDPTVGELLGDVSSQIAPCWTDLSPNNGGEIWVRATAGFVSITWENVPQFNTANANTVQCLLEPNGDITLSYIRSEFTGADLILGVSAGNGAADPGESDLSSALSSGAASELYELFDSSVPEAFDLFETSLPQLVAFTDPVLGQSFEVGFANAPRALLGWILIGRATTIDLGQVFIGSGLDGCFLRTDGILFTGMVDVGSGLSVPVPAVSSLEGVAVSLQGITFDPFTASNAFGLLPTNELIATLGL